MDTRIFTTENDIRIKTNTEKIKIIEVCLDSNQVVVSELRKRILKLEDIIRGLIRGLNNEEE